MCLVSASVVWALRCAGAAGGRRALPHLLGGTADGLCRQCGRQSVQTLALPRARGDFYDRTGRRLTGLSQRYYALCLPGDAGYTALFPYVPYAEQSLLYERRNLASPFLIQVDRDLTAQGITTCTVPQHSAAAPPRTCWAIWTARAAACPAWKKPTTICWPPPETRAL